VINFSWHKKPAFPKQKPAPSRVLQFTALTTVLSGFITITGALADEWDGPTDQSNNAVEGGSGVWDNVATNWTLDGGDSNTAWTRSGVGEFTLGSGTIDLQDTVSIGGLSFSTTNYTIEDADGSGDTLELTSDADIDVAPGGTATISAGISETASFSLTKTGEGSLAFSGASKHTGGTIVQAGTFENSGTIDEYRNGDGDCDDWHERGAEHGF